MAWCLRAFERLQAPVTRDRGDGRHQAMRTGRMSEEPLRVNTPFRRFHRSKLEDSLHGCFERQVSEHGDRVAVVDPRGELTYTALDVAASRIAAELLNCGNTVGSRTALLLPQGGLLTAAILGVLKTGGAYVPIDASRPHDWNAWQIADAGCERLLCAPADLDLGRSMAPADTTILPVVFGVGTRRPAAVDVQVDPSSMACIYYTSGSTGRPKGVYDSHRNILHNVMRYTNSLHIAADDRLSLIQSPVFSGTMSSLFGALLNGASLACMDLREEGLDALPDWVRAQDVTIYHSVPSVFRTLCVGNATYPRVRIVRLEGDQASSRDFKLFRRHFDTSCLLVNGLGCTECGLVRQNFLSPASHVEEGLLGLGTAVPDMEILILDERGESAVPFSIGEIAVKSRYLALGYWGQPELTAERFTGSADGSGARVYRTGDLGSLDDNGKLSYRGRKDQQFKIEGQHVDLAKVEAALRSFPWVHDAVAQTRADDPDHPRLVAYLVAADPSRRTSSPVRTHLAAQLPPHMIPTRTVWLDNIPLSADGKVDRNALPAPPAERPLLEKTYLPPRSPTERTLVRLWEELLDISPIGINDSFLDLGGDSLLAIQLLQRLHSTFGGRIGMAMLYESATIEQLATAVDQQRRSRARQSTDASNGQVPRFPGGTNRP